MFCCCFVVIPVFLGLKFWSSEPVELISFVFLMLESRFCIVLVMFVFVLFVVLSGSLLVLSAETSNNRLSSIYSRFLGFGQIVELDENRES